MSSGPTAGRPKMGKAEASLLKIARGWLATLSLDETYPASIRDAAMAATEQDDVTAAMRGIGDACLALEGLAKAAADRSKDARRVLLQLIEESGVPSVLLAHHTVDVITPDPKLSVTDPKKIPPTVKVQDRVIELWTTPDPPKPKPDLDAISLARKAGAKIEGVELSNGTPYVRFTANQKAAKPKAKAKGAAA